MALELCRVSVPGVDGTVYQVEVTAESLYEAIAKGIKIHQSKDRVGRTIPAFMSMVNVRKPRDRTWCVGMTSGPITSVHWASNWSMVATCGNRIQLINHTFAKRYFKGQNPLGRHISPSNKSEDQWAVVGISADSKYANVNEESMPMAFFPYKQRKGTGTMQVELRTMGNPTTFLPAIQKEVRNLAPNLPLLQPMTQQAQSRIRIPRSGW
jgi:hypothetical protein